MVEPSPYADSFNIGGVTSNTSRITEAMNGITMIARMMPADRMPMPTGGPLTRLPRNGTPDNRLWSGA